MGIYIYIQDYRTYICGNIYIYNRTIGHIQEYIYIQDYRTYTYMGTYIYSRTIGYIYIWEYVYSRTTGHTYGNIQQDYRTYFQCQRSVVHFCNSRTRLQLISICLYRPCLTHIQIKLFYYQVTCFDLRPGPANIEDTKTTKSQEEEPCVCYTTTKISISVSVTISVTIVFYLIFKCKTKFRK